MHAAPRRLPRTGSRPRSRRLRAALLTPLLAVVATVAGIGPGLGAPPAAAGVPGSAVLPFDAIDAGATAGLDLAAPVVGVAPTPSGGGYWLVAADGGVFTFGDAPFLGSAGGLPLNAPVVGVAPTPSGGGYWLVAADGGVFTFGDAAFVGSAGGLPLNAPVVGIVPTPSGAGYRLVAADGGLFAYGDAAFLGSAGGLPLHAPVVGAAGTASGGGYWMVARDGGVFTYGDAPFHGRPSTPAPVVGLAAAPAGGYWVADADGGVHSFGPAPFSGSAAGACLDQPVAGVAADPDGVGYWLVTRPVPVPQPAPGTSPLAALAQQSDDVRARLRLRQACQPDGGRRALLTPVPGARRSQAFGPRIHPVFGVPQVHTGLDFAAAAGTAIRAPADGVVVDVALRAGYGWATVIDHGGRVATLLAHQSSVAVGAGQAVAAGQVVGRVGSTGYATGPHLHLEVRVGGDPVDPAPWL